MRSLLLVITCILPLISIAQQTVGTFLNTPGSYNGYTLFSPMAFKTTYLIDNCGRLTNSWSSDYRPGMSAYLLEDGSLLRARALLTNSTFNAGGTAGGVERMEWDGNLLWEYELSTPTECSHHDIEYLPNGNVLFIVWEVRTSQEAVAAGRNPDNIVSEVWPDKIVEVEPIGTDSGNVVWEWNSWDHLIQDYDSGKDNFGVVAEHPELININYGAQNQSDWLHINSVDYNPIFDQIVLSVHRTNELWVIDHSTTTLEAAGHTGGNSGKGGDLLYRWGNPEAYDSGYPADQMFFGQHDAQWITEGSDEGKLMVFNNGRNRTQTLSYSSIDIIDPPVDIAGIYTEPTAGESFLPSELFWSFNEDPPTDFYSMNISGAQRMPNGNTLICEGAKGHLFEVNSTGDVVWDYQTPVGPNGPVEQGATVTGNGKMIFRAYRYGPDYAGLNGHDLTPGNTVELNSTVTGCNIYGTSVGIDAKQAESIVTVYPNPATDRVTIFSNGHFNRLRIYDSLGKEILNSRFRKPSSTISTIDLPSGIYSVTLNSPTTIVHSKLVVQ